MAGMDAVIKNKVFQRGFTIVELLIVIVVIGVLAAIVVVAYNGITASARDAAIQSDLKGFAKSVELWKAQNGQYPAQAAMSASMGIKVSKDMYEAGLANNWYYCSNTARTRFAVGATAQSSRAGYVYDSETGMRTEAAVWGSTTCPSTVGSDPYFGSGAWSGCVWNVSACTWSAWIN